MEREPERVEAVQENAAVLRAALREHGLEAGPSRTQIIPVLIGDPARAVAACGRALEAGVFAQAIRPPTVPDGTSRLRLTVMASHRPAELRRAAAAIAAAVQAVSADGDWALELDLDRLEAGAPLDTSDADPAGEIAIRDSREPEIRISRTGAAATRQAAPAARPGPPA